ncbi:hypothetical protein CYLTODRAFT_131503 [Cylindrobasidium torrendii FP15055 ss-10]|uniref:Uncharacterized protein n=1 Tax=Cylindrobasidium torrendii FP15055 ss-10 TaxID=1314674 RepID=A0A0D7AZE4_9AGAR|nr:hypothetical protein CYLTODRAFT_131503 [Cylindrobasidium torrendii FP15055 ss-10]
MPKDYAEALPAHTSTNDPSPAKRRRITLFDKHPSFSKGAEHLFDDDEDLCPPSPSRTSPVKPRIPGPMKKPVSSVAAGPSRVAARGPFALSTKGPFRKPLFAKPIRRHPPPGPALIDLDATPTPSPVQTDPLDLASPIKLGSPDVTSPTKDDIPETSSSPYLGRGSTPVTDWDSSPPRGKKAHDSSPPSSALRNAPSSPLLPCSQQYAQEIIVEDDEEEAEDYDLDEPEFGDEPSSPLAHRGGLDPEKEQELDDKQEASPTDALRETLDPHAQVHGRDPHNGRRQVYIETPLPPPSFPLPYQPSYPLSDDEVEEEDLLDTYEAVVLSPSPTGKKRKRILSGRERGIATEPRRGVPSVL